MISIRKSQDRGLTSLDWLTSYHSFSFGDYIDLNHRGFENLRVINEDEIVAGTGFDYHPHANMEIVTYVLSGTLEHKDSMGNCSLINAGDVQRMSAGTGILHSEYNHSQLEPVRLMQIWIFPEERDIEPSYEQKHFDDSEVLRLLVSKTGRDGSVTINQDIDIYLLRLQTNEEFLYSITKEKAWLQVLRGSLKFDGHELTVGDACAIEQAQELSLSASGDLELLIFDMHSKVSRS